MMVELPADGDLAAHYELPGLRLVGPVAQPGINNRVTELEANAGRFVLKVYQSHSDPATILAAGAYPAGPALE
ncbi:MAG TPA: hypothetical protein VNK95_12135 [Caldilineaceae bacterium]|nr:hypothetical protein [Caldilineaceae bacterium]